MTRAEATAEAAYVLVEARAHRDTQPVEVAAEAAYIPGGPPPEDLADLIRHQRNQVRDTQGAAA